MKNTKNKISSNVSKELGISKKESKRFVNVFVKIMKEAISQKTTKINNFGTFYKKQTKKRVGRNPKTLEEYPINPFTKIYFRPSNSVKKNIN